jgi:hypothetical protein
MCVCVRARSVSSHVTILPDRARPSADPLLPDRMWSEHAAPVPELRARSMPSLIAVSQPCFIDSDVACSTHCLRGVIREKQNWRSIASAGSACAV